MNCCTMGPIWVITKAKNQQALYAMQDAFALDSGGCNSAFKVQGIAPNPDENENMNKIKQLKGIHPNEDKSKFVVLR